jgi:transposase
MPRPLVLAPLEAEDREELLERFNDTADPESRTRYQMVLLATDRQMSTPEIAALVFRSHDTVWRVLRRFQEHGLDAVPRRHGGGPQPALTEDALAEIVRVIEDDPHPHGIDSPNWTTGLLATYLACKTGITVDPETVRVALHRLGYVCKRPNWTVQHKAQEREDWVGNASG